MRSVTAIVAVSDDLYQTWQVDLLLASLKENSFEGRVHILIFKPSDRKYWSSHWVGLIAKYEQVSFYFYEDDGSVYPQLKNYTTIHRLFSLREHFKKLPQLKDHAILYLDSDVLLTKKLDLEPLLQDNICYGADIRSYNSYDYFKNKVDKVRPERLEKYLIENPLSKIWKHLGVSEEIVKANNENTAGVHYLLKGIDADFWDEILQNCVPLIKQLEYLNNHYMVGNTKQERSNNGFQSFCADIYLTLWGLWKRGIETKIAPQLNFTWATDSIESLQNTNFYHNAGITPNLFFEGVGPSFYKGKYANNDKTPFDDAEGEYLKIIHENSTSKKYANWHYVDYILKLKTPCQHEAT